MRKKKTEDPTMLRKLRQARHDAIGLAKFQHAKDKRLGVLLEAEVKAHKDLMDSRRATIDYVDKYLPKGLRRAALVKLGCTACE